MDCKQRLSNPNRINMFDAAFEWVPFLNTQSPVDGGAFWLYTYFMTGQSAACLESNCNEAAVYRNMPLHLTAARTTAWGNSIDFLPGTIFNYRVPMPSATKLDLYTNLIGVLAMVRPPQVIPVNGIESVPSLTVERRFAGNSCSPGINSSLICNNNGIYTAVAVRFNHDLAADAEVTPITQYVSKDVFAETKEFTLCCEVITLFLHMATQICCLCYHKLFEY